MGGKFKNVRYTNKLFPEGGHKEMSSILADQERSQMRGDGGGGLRPYLNSYSHS